MMKCEAQTEADMRGAEVEPPKSTADLIEYIDSLVDREHDYGTCVYAMSMAATAAFYYVASRLGVTGFQASCADLDFLRRIRHMGGPFILLKGEDMLYPQYDLHRKLSEAMDGWREWAAEEARKFLASRDSAHPDVVAHWQKLAEFQVANQPEAP